MRHGQARLVDRLLAVEQEVEVDRARAVARPRPTLAAELALDLEQAVEQLAWAELCLDLRHGVEERRLVLVAPRLRLADRRQPAGADALGRLPDRPLAVAEVRAEPDVGPGHGRVDGDGRVLGGRVELDLRLPYPHPDALDCKAAHQLVRQARGERLQQADPLAIRDLAHARCHLAVVDVRSMSSASGSCRGRADVERNVWPSRSSTPWRRGGRRARRRAARSSRRATPPHGLAARRARAQSSRPRSTAALAASTLAASGPIVALGVAEQPAERALARRADEHRTPERDELVEPAQQLEVVLDRLAEADPGIEADALLRGSPQRPRTRAAPRETPSPPRRRRRSEDRPASSAARRACASGKRRHPTSATTPARSGSPRSAVTSLTSSAPSSRARRATSAFEVSIETGTSPASPSSTGTTRRSSSSTETPCDPGRVDSPPTSTIAAPSSTIRRAEAAAASGSRCTPPSENESGRDVDDAHHRRDAGTAPRSGMQSAYGCRRLGRGRLHRRARERERLAASAPAASSALPQAARARRRSPPRRPPPRPRRPAGARTGPCRSSRAR